MNKKLIIVILLISVVFCGCNYKRDKSEIEKIVSDFYITDYSYEETTEKYADDGSLILRLVYEGEVFQKPYKEHKKVISCDNFNRTANKQLNEIYFQGSDKAVTTYISTDDGWTNQLTTRNYPYGYAESISFSKIPDETFSTDHVDVYIGEYTVLLSSKNSSFQKLSATVPEAKAADTAAIWKESVCPLSCCFLFDVLPDFLPYSSSFYALPSAAGKSLCKIQRGGQMCPFTGAFARPCCSYCCFFAADAAACLLNQQRETQLLS